MVPTARVGARDSVFLDGLRGGLFVRTRLLLTGMFGAGVFGNRLSRGLRLRGSSTGERPCARGSPASDSPPTGDESRGSLESPDALGSSPERSAIRRTRSRRQRPAENSPRRRPPASPRSRSALRLFNRGSQLRVLSSPAVRAPLQLARVCFRRSSQTHSAGDSHGAPGCNNFRNTARKTVALGR